MTNFDTNLLKFLKFNIMSFINCDKEYNKCNYYKI